MSRTDTPGNESVTATERPGSYPADLDRTDRDRPDKDQADLDRADLERADLDRTDVDRADLDRADTHPADTYESGDRAEAGEPREEQDIAPSPPIESAVPEQRVEPPAAVGTAPADQHSSPAVDKLFEATVAGRFHERWRDVQAGFVDDPAQAVRSAGDLLDEVSSELASAINRQRAAITTSEGSKADDETEHLRRTLQSYRRVVTRLLDI